MIPLTPTQKAHDVALPNVYYVTVSSAATGRVHHVYVSGDYVGQAIGKARQWCEEHHGFRPMATTSEINIRRFRLGDYLENPEGLDQALAHEQHMGSLAAAESLAERKQRLAAVLREDDLRSVPMDALD